MTKFEIGKEYGNDLTIKVLDRTAKFIKIETNAFGTCRVKIKNYNPKVEEISFKCWRISANDDFDLDKAREIAFDRAYHS